MRSGTDACCVRLSEGRPEMKKNISEQEIQMAIELFKSRGGLMKQLPAEKTPILNLVGRKWSQYEEGITADFSSPEYY